MGSVHTIGKKKKRNRACVTDKQNDGRQEEVYNKYRRWRRHSKGSFWSGLSLGAAPRWEAGGGCARTCLQPGLVWSTLVGVVHVMSLCWSTFDVDNGHGTFSVATFRSNRKDHVSRRTYVYVPGYAAWKLPCM